MHPRGIAHLGSARTAGARGVRGMIVTLALLACAEPPVRWDDTRTAAASASGIVAPDGALVPDTMAMLAARIPPPERALCPGSLVLARAGTRLFAAWWRVRPDSGALLLAAHTDDEGRTWSTPAPVDTTDRAVSGCSRSAPAIAADSASGYVHVVFALLGREGPGLFYAHSMDAGATFHAAVPIFYGDRLGRSSVAADGDLVAVAFEDPNSRTPRIGLALSRTMGHIFEERLLPISDDHGVATKPVTAVRGRRIAVAWHRRAPADSASAVLAVRTGVVR
ncbi:MAG TPA: sialidase family protein [Gemmatimonadaceae bacterium]|nr:sialidase family protein [Gemmatimonadaceae bacterium]